METFIYALILAALTGITIFAYREQAMYSAYCLYLSTAILFVFIGTFVWDIALWEASWAVTDVADMGSEIEIRRAIRELSVPGRYQALIAVANLYLYFLASFNVLRWLHETESTGDNTDGDKDGE